MDKTRELCASPVQEKDINARIRGPKRATSSVRTPRHESPSPHLRTRSANRAEVDLEKGKAQERIDEISPQTTYLIPTIGSSKPSGSVDSTRDAVKKAFGSNLDRIPESEWVEEDALDYKGFSRRVADAGGREMFHDLVDGKDRVVGEALNLSTMQRMNLHPLQREVVRVASDIYEIQQRPQNLEREPDWYRLKLAMANYCG